MGLLLCYSDSCLRFQRKARLLLLNVMEDTGVGSERICSAAEGSEG